MNPPLYLWRINLRGHILWCHAPSSEAALKNFIIQTGEPLEEYCLEWHSPKNLDGTEVSPAELQALIGNI
jgi:hypothetical protein